jgi:iron complex outermembrane recepter protein
MGIGGLYRAAAQSQPAGAGHGDQDSASGVNPADLGLEQLANMNVKVTSVSKKEESLSGAPAAIYVITSEDIARGGFASVPDALRMVPGLSVAQVNAHAWMISARGFDDIPNEKMLVLIDGRSVYTPLYGGVNWDVQEIPLEEIDRIEVIRGPGGTLWGENAINGVINIITKNTEQTQGGYATSSYGYDEGDVAGARFGGRVGERFSYRIYGSGAYWEPFVDASGKPLHNNWDMVQGGTRMEWKPTMKDAVTLEMRGYDGQVGDIGNVTTPTSQTTVSDRYPIHGENILARWEHTFSERSSAAVLAYCDWTDRGDIAFAAESRNTCDLETQHNFQIKPRHSIVWGTQFRTTGDQTRVTFYNHFTPPGFRENLFGAFGQYEWDIVPNRLKLIAGVKLGHNPYTGFETQPQIRAVWTPHKGHNVWGAVSRAVRIPTRNETDNFLIANDIPGPVPTHYVFIGNPDLRAASLRAYELGYRFQPGQKFSLDAAAFYNEYHDLIFPFPSSLPPIVNQNPPYTLIPLTFSNGFSSQTHGLEVGAKWMPWHPWLLSVGVTEDRGTSFSMSSTPQHQFNVQSRLDLPHNFNFDSALYHYAGIPPSAVALILSPVPIRNRVDAGLSWHTPQGLTLELLGRNLQASRHAESAPTFVDFAESGDIRRSVVARISWDFSREKKPSK